MYWALELYENNYFPAARPFLHKHQVLELLFFLYFETLDKMVVGISNHIATYMFICINFKVNDNTAYACTFLYKHTQFAKI
jgi:hypothetical protein